MADVAAQREARRRKITENAEARMNRLLGLTKNREQKHELTSQTELNNSPLEISDAHSQGNQEHSSSIHLSSHSSTASTSLTSRPISDSLTTPTFSDRSLNGPANYSTTGQRSTGTSSILHHVENTHSVQQTYAAKSEHESKSLEKASKDNQGQYVQTFEIIKIISFVVLALLQRCLLKFHLGLCIVPSIFVPFIILEITFEYVVYKHLQHVVVFHTKGNLMSAALMLCGMKQDLTDTYNNIMAHITAWLSDFCLYTFVFILVNALVV